MFQEKYKAAYDAVLPQTGSLERIYVRAGLVTETEGTDGTDSVHMMAYTPQKRNRMMQSRGLERWQKVLWYILRPAAVTVLSFCLVLMLALPVAAKQVPGVYRVVEKYAPALANFVLPRQIASTGHGITMQVEAIDIRGNEADIIISFSDEADSPNDLINGRVDLYDSYHLYNYSAKWQAGGCSFLEYDSGEDKAYFKISTTASADFDGEKVGFGVTKLLTEYRREIRLVGFEPWVEAPLEKTVSVNGGGGKEGRGRLYFLAGGSTDPSPLREYRVMDLGSISEDMKESLKVTGVAYDEGVLRVQQCRGNFADADRHIRLFLKDENGAERTCDGSVMWQEEIDGQKVLLEEAWFVVTQEELEQLELWGEYWIADGCIRGDWEVIFEMENLPGE